MFKILQMLKIKVDTARLLQSINLAALKICCFNTFECTICGKHTNAVPGHGSKGSKEERNFLQLY